MQPQVDVSVVLPLFNHAQVVADTVEAVQAAFAGRYALEVVLVNDGSSDDTQRVAAALQPKSARIVVVQLERNCGQATAVAVGLSVARGRMLATSDVDLDCGADAIVAMAERVEQGVELVCGQRLRPATGPVRRMGSWVVNRLVRRLYGVALQDFGCGTNVGSRALLKRWQQTTCAPHLLKLVLLRLATSVEEYAIVVPGRAHAPRSSYTLLALFRRFFDVVTGPWLLDQPRSLPAFSITHLPLLPGEQIQDAPKERAHVMPVVG